MKQINHAFDNNSFDVIFIILDNNTINMGVHLMYVSWVGKTRRDPSPPAPQLNSEFSFSKTYCHTKVKELSKLYFLPLDK